jgi:hypothetical protein
MRFNVLVMRIDNSRSKTIVAHNLAGNRGVSLQHALSLLENLPVIYQTNVSKDDADASIARLNTIGVKAGAVPAEIGVNAARENKTKETAPATPETIPRQPSTEPMSVPRPHFTYIRGVKPDVGPLVSSGRKKLRIGVLVITVCFIGLIFVGARVKFKFFLPDSSALNQVPGVSKQKTGMLNNPGRKAQWPDRATDTQSQTPAIPDEQVRQATAYADSAKACTSVNEAIIFYKMAISINKRNMDAWYGLINAYTQAQMPEDADRARLEMQKVFGDGAFLLVRIVQRFGDLIDLHRAEDGTYRVEYRSRQAGRTEQTELLHETFLLVKAFAAEGGCSAISLYARTGKTAGVLVYVKTDPVPASYTEFIARAAITNLK